MKSLARGQINKCRVIVCFSFFRVLFQFPDILFVLSGGCRVCPNCFVTNWLMCNQHHTQNQIKLRLNTEIKFWEYLITTREPKSKTNNQRQHRWNQKREYQDNMKTRALCISAPKYLSLELTYRPLRGCRKWRLGEDD